MTTEIKLGLKENWKQFSLLVLINGFVGAMVGLERSILPDLASEEFGLVVKTSILSFIAVFGLTKAIANYYAGRLANSVGRKKILIIGWLIAVPVPFILIYAPSWGWVLLANAFLGVNQGLAWSSTVLMKIDLVGPKQRGFAMGINESVGYLAVGLVAIATGYIATEYGLRPYPFYLGYGFVGLGLILSLLFVKDTQAFVSEEEKSSNVPEHKNIFRATSWSDKNLGSVTYAGVINNLGDAFIWGLLPLHLASLEYSLDDIGLVVAFYPATWGLAQIYTGKLADKRSKRDLISNGMFLQALAVLGFFIFDTWKEYAFGCALLGLGTALVYPTFAASISEHTKPSQRAESIGVFRLWRDLGYVFGAVLAGLLADYLGMMNTFIVLIALLISAYILVFIRMEEYPSYDEE